MSWDKVTETPSLGLSQEVGQSVPSVASNLCSSVFLCVSPVSLCPGVEGLSLDVSFLVDIRDYVNKELALRIHTDIDSQGTFFTDLNGFQVTSGSPGQKGDCVGGCHECGVCNQEL